MQAMTHVSTRRRLNLLHICNKSYLLDFATKHVPGTVRRLVLSPRKYHCELFPFYDANISKNMKREHPISQLNRYPSVFVRYHWNQKLLQS